MYGLQQNSTGVLYRREVLQQIINAAIYIHIVIKVAVSLRHSGFRPLDGHTTTHGKCHKLEHEGFLVPLVGWRERFASSATVTSDTASSLATEQGT
jgi:hypothetical protein